MSVSPFMLIPSISVQNDRFGAEIANHNENTFSIYAQVNGVLRTLRKVHLWLCAPLFCIWYGCWKYSVPKASKIILFDSLLDIGIIPYISKKNIGKNNKLIFWFWNPVKEEYLKPLRDNHWEIWTFDRSEAERYRIKFNTQFYFNTFQAQANEILYDVLFVGRDKGRSGYLNTLKQELNTHGLNSNFFIFKNLKWYERFFKQKNNFMSYQSILEYIGASKAILDIGQERQAGLTLRPLEALFFNKKLITNSPNIKSYDFYDKQNVFILGEDDFSDIYTFINSPLRQISQRVKKYYDFSEWLERFDLQ